MVSGYTAYVQREQLRAQVRPHLTIESNNVDPDSAWYVINVDTACVGDRDARAGGRRAGDHLG